MPEKSDASQKGIEIANCWKEFNPYLKKIFPKKIPHGNPTEK